MAPVLSSTFNLQETKMKNIATGLVATTALLVGVAFAQDANMIKHPNLRAAYDAVNSALGHINAAQANNQMVKFGGHEAKAEKLLREAKKEIEAGDAWNVAHPK
jgi:hypothetical protein